jgi:hypothetical protein
VAELVQKTSESYAKSIWVPCPIAIRFSAARLALAIGEKNALSTAARSQERVRDNVIFHGCGLIDPEAVKSRMVVRWKKEIPWAKPSVASSP